MAAGKAPPPATPTVAIAEPEEDVLEEFPVTFPAPPSTAMADIHRPQVRAWCISTCTCIYIRVSLFGNPEIVVHIADQSVVKRLAKKEALFSHSLYSTLFQ